MTIISWQFPLPVRSKHTNAFFKVMQMSPRVHRLGKRRWTCVWRKNNSQGVWRGKTVLDILWLSPPDRGVRGQRDTRAAPSERLSLHAHSCQGCSQSQGLCQALWGQGECKGQGMAVLGHGHQLCPNTLVLPGLQEGCTVSGLAWARTAVSPSLLLFKDLLFELASSWKRTVSISPDS